MNQKNETGTKLNNKHKTRMRKVVLFFAKITGDLFDFFGDTGAMYHYVRKQAPQCKVTSIDDGRGFKNKATLKEEFKRLPGTMLTTFRKLAKEGIHKFGTIWLDYCGPFGDGVMKDIEVARNIMKDEGYIFITLLLAREKFMAKGTHRKVINEVTIKLLKEEFRKRGIELKHFFKYNYVSSAQRENENRLGRCEMGMFGFKYKKIEIPEEKQEECKKCKNGFLCTKCLEKE